MGVGRKISKFAVDTKLFYIASGLNDCFRLQSNLDRLIAWADKWQMQFNYWKCKVFRLGRENREFCYDIDSTWIREAEGEKDLRVVVDKSFKFSKNSLEASKPGFIKRNVSYKNKEVILRLYNSYVRSHLEYCVQAWSPYLDKISVSWKLCSAGQLN